MKNLKKEIRRLLSLILTAAVIVSSASSEILTVQAAQINEDSIESDLLEGAESQTKIERIEPESVWMKEPEGEESGLTEKQTVFETMDSMEEILYEEVGETDAIQDANTEWKSEPSETEIWEMPESETFETESNEASESNKITDADESLAVESENTVTIRFSIENASVKDSDGNLITNELLVMEGTKDAIAFTVELSEGYLLKYVGADSQSSTIVVQQGASVNEYIILPQNMENGYIWDECVRIIAVPVESYTVPVHYEFSADLDCVENVIVANGDVWNENSPREITISNVCDTCVYVKIGKIQGPEIWIPEITLYYTTQGGIITHKVLSYQDDINAMNAKEKELLQQGYYIFHLGKLIDAERININLKEHYQTRFVTTGFPGNVRIFNYIADGYDEQGTQKWRKEEIKDVIVAERGEAILLQVEWEDTPDHAYRWCELDISADSKIYVNNDIDYGIEGKVQAVFIYEETTIELALKPHEISLDYFMGDITDISAGDGVIVSENNLCLEVYGGDQLSLNVTFMDGLQLDNLSDYVGADWSIQEHGGQYTITLIDMEKIPDINKLRITVWDTLSRYSLSDGYANCQVKSIRFKNNKSDVPVYTGEAIEVEYLTLTAELPGQGNDRTFLVLNKDFTVSYVNNMNAGNAIMIVTAVPDSVYFRGSCMFSFMIDKAEFPQEEYKTFQMETGNRQYTHQINLSELFWIKQPNGEEIVPLGYRLDSYEKGEVLIPEKDPVLEGDTITVTIRDDADKNASLANLIVCANYENYKDYYLRINIQAVQKRQMMLGGTVTISDKEYDGKGVLPNADEVQILSIEGSSEPISEELLNEIQETLEYRFTGVDGTVYSSKNVPSDAGTYKVEVKVFEENPDYQSAYTDAGTFRITQRAVRVIADDTKLYRGDTIPAQYSYQTERLVEGDAVSTKSFISCGIQSTDTSAEYPIMVDAAAVKIADSTGKDVTANYLITGQEGKLTVCEPEQGSYSVTYARIDPHNPQKNMKYSGNHAGMLLKKPTEPTADGYVFLGWYTDEASTGEWNFDTDVVQRDLTLYAGWSKKADDRGGIALCVQDILPQIYTGTAIKPNVIVYAADAKTRLKYKTDYTVTYKNNINADTMAFPDSVPQGGFGEALSDTTHGFHSDLPYVIIQGKGNYAGTVYVNFHICPANIAQAQTNTSEYSLKYTDQLEEKPGRYGAVVTKLQYKKKSLRYNKDYLLSVEKAGSKDGESVAVALNAKGQLPLTAGTYQVTITGKDNFTGEITKTLYIADKTQLFKYAKVTCKTVISDVTGEELNVGIQPENLVVTMNGVELAKDAYTVTCANNHAIGRASVTVRANENGYFGSKCVTFQIKGSDFKENAVLISGWQEELRYTGKPLTQNDVVLKTKDGRDLIYGVDYAISYKDNIQKGTAAVTFTANPASGYSGSFHKKFKITPMDLETAVQEGTILITGVVKTDSGWKLSKRVPYQKGGAMPIDDVSLQLTTSGAVLECGKAKDYTVKYTNNKEVSNATAYMTLQGLGNYTGSVDIFFDIEKASLFQIYQEGRATVTTASIKVAYPHGRAYVDYGYGEGEWLEDQLKDPNRKFEPAVTIKDGKAILKKDVDYTVEYYGNTRSELESGDLLGVIIKGKGNYGADDDEIELNVTVNRRTLTNAKVEVTTYENTFTYTGEQILPEVAEVRYKTYNGYGKEDSDYYDPPEWETLKLGEDYRIAYSKNIVQGTGTIQIIGIGAYTGSASKSFKINSKEIYNKTPK